MSNIEKQLKNLPKMKLNFRADSIIRFRLARQTFLMGLDSFISSFSLKKGLAFALLVVLVFSGTSVYAYESPSVTQGSGLYPLKKVIEQIEIKIASTVSEEKEIKTYVKFAEKRVNEYIKINEKSALTSDGDNLDTKSNSNADKTIEAMLAISRIIAEKSLEIEKGDIDNNRIDLITNNQLNAIEVAKEKFSGEKFEKDLEDIIKEIENIRENYKNNFREEDVDKNNEDMKDEEERHNENKKDDEASEEDENRNEDNEKKDNSSSSHEKENELQSKEENESKIEAKSSTKNEIQLADKKEEEADNEEAKENGQVAGIFEEKNSTSTDAVYKKDDSDNSHNENIENEDNKDIEDVKNEDYNSENNEGGEDKENKEDKKDKEDGEDKDFSSHN